MVALLELTPNKPFDGFPFTKARVLRNDNSRRVIKETQKWVSSNHYLAAATLLLRRNRIRLNHLRLDVRHGTPTWALRPALVQRVVAKRIQFLGLRL